ncbi:MAG: hypothetical protein PHD67_11295, partial [Oscillospiraceae bacterium]|nr:hypothetical protein [Oscillospiraceae bacterium]
VGGAAGSLRPVKPRPHTYKPTQRASAAKPRWPVLHPKAERHAPYKMTICLNLRVKNITFKQSAGNFPQVFLYKKYIIRYNTIANEKQWKDGNEEAYGFDRIRRI